MKLSINFKVLKNNFRDKSCLKKRNSAGFIKTQEPRLFLDSFDIINKKIGNLFLFIVKIGFFLN